MAFGEVADLAVRLSLDDKFSRGIKGASGNLNKFEGSLSRISRGTGQLSTGLARAGTIIGTVAVGGLAAAAKAAIDYESAFAGVRKTVDATEPELQALSDEFRQLARTIPISANEFARLGEIAGALGVPIEAIDEFVETTAKLGVTTELTADQAADALGRIGNIVRLTEDDYDNFGSALVNLGNKGASTEDEIIEITKRFAAAGKQAGLTTPQILGLAEATASFTGLKQEAAGSSLSRLLGTLTKVAATGGKKFETLNEIVGEDFRKALDKDANGALLKFLKGLGKLDKYERANALKELGLDSVYLRQLLGGLTDNIDGVEQSLRNADEGWRGNFLNKEAAARFDTLASKLDVFKNNIIDAGITIGTAMIPSIEKATEKLTEFLQEPGNQRELQKLGEDIGQAIDSIDWQQVIDGGKSLVGVMKDAFGWAKRLFDIFNALPAEIKGATVGLLALNKLSGGLIAGGAGNIVGGLLSPVLRNLGAALPGVGKAFVQPVFVTNWQGMGGALGGAGAAGRGGFLKGALGLTGVGLLAVLASEFEDEIQGLADNLATGWRDAVKNTVGVAIPKISPSQLEWPFGPKNTPTILPEIFGGNGVLGGTPAVRTNPAAATTTQGAKNMTMAQATIAAREGSKTLLGPINLVKSAVDATKSAVTSSSAAQTAAVRNAQSVASRENSVEAGLQRAQIVGDAAGRVMASVHAAGAAIRQATTTQAVRNTEYAARSAGIRAAGASNNAASRIVAAIWAARPVIRTTNVVEKYTTIVRTGSTSGSKNSGPLQ